MEHRIISTLELNNGEDDDFLEEDWYKELCNKIDDGDYEFMGR